MNNLHNHGAGVLLLLIILAVLGYLAVTLLGNSSPKVTVFQFNPWVTYRYQSVGNSNLRTCKEYLFVEHRGDEYVGSCRGNATTTPVCPPFTAKSTAKSPS